MKTVPGMHRRRLIHFSRIRYMKDDPIVIIYIFIVISTLVVYELTLVSYIVLQCSPPILGYMSQIGSACSIIFYAKYTSLRILEYRIQAPDHMPEVPGIYAYVY